jgi:general secretion pathway protein G
MHRNRRSGFTLLELLVVIAIIGLLTSYVAPRYFSQVGRSEAKVAKAQIVAFEQALAHYRLDMGRYPTTEQGLEALLKRPPTEPKWNGPYLNKALPLDPWGRPYVYVLPGQYGEFDLYSLGKDGRPGGKGDDADVTNL